MAISFTGVSRKLIDTCAELVGSDARSVEQLATREDRSYSAIRMRRRRLEIKLGVVFPRPRGTRKPQQTAAA